ncbi:hypothetical protein EDD85DRAFT_845884 [Armillaria nabsnona]|nr:hypothetical protein EDD85DRAFT_845884 [Armillaria nabsnona]
MAMLSRLGGQQDIWYQRYVLSRYCFSWILTTRWSFRPPSPYMNKVTLVVLFTLLSVCLVTFGRFCIANGAALQVYCQKCLKGVGIARQSRGIGMCVIFLGVITLCNSQME